MDFGTWSIEDLTAYAEQRPGPGLSTIRVLAVGRAYRTDDSPDNRRRWARLSLLANARLPGDRSSDEFILRAWVIENLGPTSDPLWDPPSLAADILASLTLDPAEAGAMAAHWRDLPIDRIRELRRHKSRIGPAATLPAVLPPGPVRDRLQIWLDLRPLLP